VIRKITSRHRVVDVANSLSLYATTMTVPIAATANVHCAILIAEFERVC